MDKKRIVHIVRSPAGGIRKHILSLIEGLNNLEFEQYLITSHEEGDINYYEFFEEYPELKSKVFNVKIVDAPGVSDLINLFKIYSLLKRLKVDVVHGHGAKGGLYARVVGRCLGAKVFYTAHGGSLHNMFDKKKEILYSFVEKILYYFTDKLIFESKYSKGQYLKKINSSEVKHELVYNGVQCLTVLPPMKQVENEFRIAAFGLLRHIKGHDLLIKAGKVLVEKGHNIKIDIYGDGEEEVNLLELIEKLELKNRIQIYKREKNILEKMQEYDVIAQPSRFESFGYVPVEAMAQGVPVVSSLEGGLREVLDNGNIGWPVLPLNEKELASTLENVINNSSMVKENRDQSFLFVKDHFSEEKFLNGMASIYKKT